MFAAARISKLFGVDGEVIISLYTTFPENFTLDMPLFVRVDALNVPLYLEKFERRGKTSAHVAFADIDTARRVSEFMGQELFCAEDLVQGEYSEEDEEFFMEDLIGFEVVANGIEGELTDFYDSKHNPLFGLTLKGYKDEILLPAAEEFIVAIDFEGRKIEFSLPEGLLEL